MREQVIPYESLLNIEYQHPLGHEGSACAPVEAPSGHDNMDAYNNSQPLSQRHDLTPIIYIYARTI